MLKLYYFYVKYIKRNTYFLSSLFFLHFFIFNVHFLYYIFYDIIITVGRISFFFPSHFSSLFFLPAGIGSRTTWNGHRSIPVDIQRKIDVQKLDRIKNVIERVNE